MSTFQLPTLPYSYDALSPWIDAETMEIHHTKHHQGYINKLNALLKEDLITNFPTDLEEACRKVGTYKKVALRNQLGGHYNHTLFWTLLSKEKQMIPSKLEKAICTSFGSVASFMEQFSQKAIGHFGSGWAWLAIGKDEELFLTTTLNQDNPLMEAAPEQGIPILGLDLWEHAYYLSYRNRRADYVQGFWEKINWEAAYAYYQNGINS